MDHRKTENSPSPFYDRRRDHMNFDIAAPAEQPLDDVPSDIFERRSRERFSDDYLRHILPLRDFEKSAYHIIVDG